jgi:3-dehydroquinate synthase
MTTIDIRASKSYQVYIGNHLLTQTGTMLRSVCRGNSAVIVSDSNVFPLYGETVRSSLVQAGFQVYQFVFPAGEDSKNGNTYLELLNFLAGNEITRTDSLVALGGGVVGDLTGFAAATYLRGISFIQIPTTLLAAVDSSVGGKTAIDLPAGKNLVGAFWQPKLVLCDVDTLQTLPQEVFCDGCAEVIKYGILYDASLFDELSASGIHFDRENVIARCVELKRDVVAQDEFDTGCRMKLNLGHTIGHGIEAQSNYSVSHGRAVGIGLCIVARASASSDFCSPATAERIVRIVKHFHLPTTTEYDEQMLYASSLSDKKRTGRTQLPNICPR